MISHSDNLLEFLLLRNVVERNTHLELENHTLKKSIDEKDHLMNLATVYIHNLEEVLSSQEEEIARSSR